MITYSEIQIKKLAIHYVGNKANEGYLGLSKNLIDINDEFTIETLSQYFFSSFKTPEYYAFKEDENFLNEIKEISQSLFTSDENFLELSQQISNKLFESTDHPNIKDGDLIVALFDDVLIDDEMVSAIGIFKSETKDPFLKLDKIGEAYDVENHWGLDVKKVEKGALIFNTEQDSNYKICVIDKSNKTEAKFWKEHFLNLTPRNDDFHNTTNYIKMTNDFVKDELAPLNDLDKSEVAEIMQRSSEFFTKVESFNNEDYAQQVFKNEESVEAFNSFKEEYVQDSNIKLEDSFEVNQEAVKKNKRIFKSIIKLDKNFHVYIHGAKDKIEKGQEGGQKFYKLFYDEEK